LAAAILGRGTIAIGLFGWIRNYQASRSDAIIADIQEAMPPQLTHTPRPKRGADASWCLTYARINGINNPKVMVRPLPRVPLR